MVKYKKQLTKKIKVISNGTTSGVNTFNDTFNKKTIMSKK